MELIKNVVLIIATIFCINGFRKSPGQGIILYLILYSICSLVGFSRGIFEEAIILPVCLIVFGRSYNPGWLLYILFIICLTLFKGNKVFGEYDEVMIAGFMLLATRNSIFSNESNIYKSLCALWLFAQCKILNLIILTGSSAFSIADANEMSSRMLDSTTVFGVTIELDPNYIAIIAGLGLIITFFMVRNPDKFNLYIGHNWFNNRILLFAFLLIDLFFSVRGLSRGVLLAIIGAFVAYMYYSRVKLKYVVLFAISAIALYYFADYIPIVGGYIDRFESDNTGGGRYQIWDAIVNVIMRDGYITMLFGEGLNFHWWAYDNTVSMGELLSSHNSIITIFTATGIIGVVILCYVFLKAFVYANKYRSIVSIYKIVLLSYILLGCMSIEPLHYIWAWIVLALGCSINRYSVIKNNIYVRY